MKNDKSGHKSTKAKKSVKAKNPKKQKLPSVYSFGGIVIDEDNVEEFNRSEGRDSKWYTDCFVVKVHCAGWLCRLLKIYMPEGGKVFASDPGPMHLFFEPNDMPNMEGYEMWMN